MEKKEEKKVAHLHAVIPEKLFLELSEYSDDSGISKKKIVEKALKKFLENV